MSSTSCPNTKKKRLHRLLGIYALVVGGGLAYALFCSVTHWGIPCPFYAVTHLKCPGCGVSRMCLCLLRLDLAGAFAANPAVLLLLPFLAYLAAVLSVRYVRDGKALLNKVENVLVYLACGLLLLFGIFRNIL